MTSLLWRGELLRWYLTRARHPFKAYVVGHYWSWFARRRVWVRYDEAALMNISLGDYLQQRIFFDGYYERTLISWLKASLKPTDVFWDVGANVGAVTLVAARFCRNVVAFEPDPRSLQLLHDNVRVSKLCNVEIVPAALGEQSGTAVLHQGPIANTGMSSFHPRPGTDATQITVATLNADRFVRERPELTPTVMKLDVEGSEALVLRGARELLQSGKLRAVIFEDQRSADARPSNAALVECLAQGGYRIDSLGPSDAGLDDGMLNFLALPAR